MNTFGQATPFQFGPHNIATWQFGHGPDLVLIHGTPFSSHVWHQIAPVLAVNFRVHMFDLLGYGASDKPDGDVSLGVQNNLMQALFDHWALDHPNVMAHDFGGATALRAHFLNALDYKKLLLIDPVAMAPWGSAFVQHIRKHQAAFAGVPDYLQTAILAAYIRTASHAGLTDAALAPYLAPWQGDEGQPAFYRQIAQMDQAFTDEVEPLYPNLRCAVSLLWGDKDAWIPLSIGEKLSQTLPQCTLTKVAGSGHLMQEDAPAAILAEALRFFGDNT